MTYTARDDMLDSYRAARHAGELAREERDYGYRTERAGQKADGVPQPVALRDWLRQAQAPAPSPEERAQVQRVLLADTHARVGAAWDAYMQACAERDAAFYDAHTDGMTYRAIARVAGISHQMVAKILGRERGR